MRGQRFAFYVPEWAHCYVAVPKAASTAIREAIATQLGVWPLERDVPDPNPLLSLLAAHRVGVQDVDALPPAVTRWSVVRNPFDRAASCWTEKLHLRLDPTPGRTLERMQGLSFEQFVRQISRTPSHQLDVHCAPQTDLLRYGERDIVDETYHLETLAETWPILMERFGLPDLPEANRTPVRPGEYADLWTPALRATFARRFRLDFEQLGYEDAK
jgi:hypothetical protein